MSCKSIVWKIGPFLDGELPPPERDEVEAHLEVCKDCVEMVAEFRALDERAGRTRVPPVSGQDWALLWERILEGRGAHVLDDGAPRVFRIRRWLVPLAAAAAIFLAGVGVTWMVLAPPVRPDGDLKDGDYAEILSGPKPVITVDKEGNVTTIVFPNF